MALACAPCTLTLNLHRFRMTTNGRILLSQLVLSCGMIASFVNSISPSLLFNTYWIALLMEYLPLFLGSISSRYDKNFSNFGLSSSFPAIKVSENSIPELFKYFLARNIRSSFGKTFRALYSFSRLVRLNGSSISRCINAHRFNKNFSSRTCINSPNMTSA